ncbi:MAG: hypothetical protein KatS3mg129_3255 [Leptospiraceae bacterium]|nr:MAG: hypothetical protein KatS3mg129_3255 [Leptospiraceae bacterium]
MTYIKHYISILFYIAIISCNTFIFGLPPYISIEERIKECTLIVIGDVQVLRQRNLFEETKSATLIVENVKVLKNTNHLSIPEFFYLYVKIYPETFENKLKFVPEEGKYIIFLEPVIKNNEVVIYKLYKEEPFALEPWTKQKEERIINFLKNQNDSKK